MSHSPDGDASPESVRYRCLDYESYYAGDDFKLFEAQTSGARQVLPAISEPLLKACSEQFRALDEHAAIICQAEPFLTVPIEAVRELLAGLAAGGLLSPHQDIVDRIRRSSGPDHRVTIGVVGVPTCNRPAGLRRVLSSALDNAAAHGRTLEVIVADDSDEARQAENVSVLRDLIERYGVTAWYAGPGEKAAFARQLAAHCDVPFETVEVALKHAPGWPGAPGSNRNTLLLHTVGDAFLTLDDDMVIEVGRVPTSDDGLAFTSAGDPTESWFYADADATLRATEFLDEDFVGLHETLLGRNVGRLAAEWRGDGPFELDQMGSDFLTSLAPDGGIVTYTMAGVLGDSGLQESLPFFFVEGASRERLLGVEGGHRAAMASRQMARGVRRATISDAHFCMGANIGLDNRRLLPPFQTAARNEDGVFSGLVRRCLPNSYIGFLPRTVLHKPVVARQFPVERFDETVGDLEAAQALLHLVWSWPQPPGRSTARRRLVALGTFMLELGRLPDPEFEDRLREIWLTLCSSEAAYIEKALKAHGTKKPDTWPADLRRYLDTLVGRLEADAPVTLRELDGRAPEAARAHFQCFLRDFGALLLVWPDLIEGTRELRRAGCRLGRRL
jgi:hypothetical protein